MIAYRTETVANKVKVENSLGQEVLSQDIYDLLDFLVEPHDDLCCFWNLDASLAPLFRLMPQHLLIDFFQRGDAYLGPFHMVFHSAMKGNVGSLFLYKGDARASYYHLSQYFPDDGTIDDLDEVVAKGAELLGELASIGAHPTSLSSHAKLLESLLAPLRAWSDEKPAIIPNWRHLHPRYFRPPFPDIEGLAYEAGGRPWVECHQVGHFRQTFDYDISQAYGSVLAMLIDPRTKYGDWVQGKDCPSGAVFGFTRGELTIDSPVSPFALLVGPKKHRRAFHTKGSWPDVISLQGFELLRDYPELGSFTPSNDSVWFVPNRVIRPLQNFVYRMHSYRAKSPLLDRIIKRSINALYGRLGQTLTDYDQDGNEVEKLGQDALFTWATTIETTTSVAVMRFLLEHNMLKSLVHVSTDGFLSTQKVALPDNNGSKPGNWRLDNEGPALILGLGSFWYGSKHPQSLFYNDVLKMIQAEPDAMEWSTSALTRTLTLGDVSYDAEVEDIGKEVSVSTTVMLNPMTLNRNFPDYPESGRELLSKHYRSDPIDAKFLLRQSANIRGGF